MRTLFPWRGRAETYLIVPLLLLVTAYSSNVAGTAVEGYWTAAVAKADILLFIIAPVCAVAGAWEGSRHRRGRIHTWAPVRPAWQVALVALAPTLMLGLLSILIAIALIAPVAVGAPGYPDPWLFVVYLLVVGAHTVVGYALGRWLPPALALPISLGGSYIWLAYPAGIEPLWLRHLNGLSFEACCALDQQPAPRALLGSALVAIGLGAGALIALSGVRYRRLAGAAALLTAVAAAVVAVQPLGPSPGIARIGAQRCAGAQPEVCLWPEQERVRGSVQSTLTAAFAGLRTTGLPLPAIVTTKEPAPDDALFVVLPSDPAPREVVLSLVSSLVPDTVPDCATQGPWPGADAREPLLVWAALAAGITRAQLADTVDPDVLRLAVQAQGLTRNQQLAWFRANLAALADCTTRRLDPGALSGAAQ